MDLTPARHLLLGQSTVLGMGVWDYVPSALKIGSASCNTEVLAPILPESRACEKGLHADGLVGKRC